MKWHPALLMLFVWCLCVLLWVALPFEVVSRNLTTYGWLILALFIGTFCIGAMLFGGSVAQRRAAVLFTPNFEMADRIIAVVSIVATGVLLADIAAGSGGDLAASWVERNERAVAILTGGEGGDLFFQIGFVTAPIAYTAIAREVIFGEAIRYVRVLVFGILPLAASAVSSGGRGPLMFALVFYGLSSLVRRYVRFDPNAPRRRMAPRQLFFGVLLVIVALLSLNYFVAVFAVRAEGAGGPAAMLDAVALRWGVTFGGSSADALIRVIGEGNSYLVFVFAWYYTQGLIFANILISDYAGPPGWGVYGIEILLGAMRRINSDYVSNLFAYLDALNAFGFVPSAFGSFFVDFGWLAFIPVFAWGCLAGLVYRKSRTSIDGRWLLPVPFVTQGILFSTINTPLGLTNGLVTLSWMIGIFVISKPPPLAAGTWKQAVPAAGPGSLTRS